MALCLFFIIIVIFDYLWFYFQIESIPFWKAENDLPYNMFCEINVGLNYIF